MIDDANEQEKHETVSTPVELIMACNGVAQENNEASCVASDVERVVRPRGLDSVVLTDNPRVRDGLADMLTAAIGEHGYNLDHIDVQLALLVIEAAKRAEDREDWFPRGKWATVQSMQERTERELRWLFSAA